MNNLVCNDFSINVNGNQTFIDGKVQAEIYLYDNQQLSKFLLIYSDINQKLLILKLEANKIIPLSLQEVLKVTDILKEYQEYFQNEKIVALLRALTSFEIIKTDKQELIRINDIYYIMNKDLEEESHTNTNIYLIAENAYKVIPKEMILVNQAIGNVGKVILDSNDSEINNIRLMRGFGIFEEKEDELIQICSSIYISVLNKNNRIEINFSSEFLESKNIQTPSFKMNIRNPLEVMDYMLSKTLMRYEIEDFQPHERSFLCIVPINGLELNDGIGVGSIEFTTRNHLEIEDEFLSRFVNDQNNSSSFAKVILTSNTYREAEIKARELVNTALDFISHIQRCDSIFFDTSTINISWVRVNVFNKLEVSSNIFIQDPLTNEYLYSNGKFKEEGSELNVDTLNDVLESLDWYEKCLLNEMDGEAQKKIKTIFIAIRYLRKSWDAISLDERLINSSIAYEFLLEDEKVEKSLEKSLRTSIAENAKKFLETIYKKSDLEERMEDVYQRVSYSLGSTFLEQKLEKLLKRLNIRLSKSDLDCLKYLRESRNKLVHGRGIPDLDEKKIFLSNGVIAKLLFYKLKDRVS
ncbi:TPA: hypothetical protein ACSVZR_003222 [Bacillus cereus]